MSISPVGATPFVPPTISTGSTSSATSGTGGAGSIFSQGLAQAEQLQTDANTAASGVATGGLTDIHQFTTASAKASLAVELTVALRNRAVDAYQEIMRMQV